MAGAREGWFQIPAVSAVAAKTILVTGASGFVGQRILQLLCASGEVHRIVALSRTSARSWPDGTEWLQTDLAAAPPPPTAFYSHVSGPAVWIHTAPLPLVSNFLPLIGGGHIRRCVAIGTTSLFAKADSPSVSERNTMREYRAAEDTMVRCCEQQNVPWTLLRPTMVYDGHHDRNVAFIAKFIRRFGFFPMAGPGDGKRQPLYADDLAQACVTVLGVAATFNRAYNLSGGETLTYRQMVERIFTALGRKPRVFNLPLPLFHVGFAMLRLLPRYRYLNTAMIARMSDDLVFDHSEAGRDFAFRPSAFLPSPQVRL